MKFEDSHREWLLRYVLGELPEEETQRADARFFSDDAFASMLDEIYRDLLDAYSAGEIAGSEKERTTRAFFAEPYQDHQRKILLAMHSSPKTVKARAHGVSKSWLLSFWPVAVATGVLSFAIVSVLYQHHQKLQAFTSREVTQNAAVSAKAPVAPTAAPSPAENTYTILLMPDVNRGNEGAQSFPVPPLAEKVVFQIVVPDSRAGATIDVRLKGSRERHVRDFSGLETRMADAQRYVEFAVPSGELPADDYALDVDEPAAPVHLIEHFVVHVTRGTARRE
jgi:hypothetical protein